jgi:hypothetical protein
MGRRQLPRSCHSACGNGSADSRGGGCLCHTRVACVQGGPYYGATNRVASKHGVPRGCDLLTLALSSTLFARTWLIEPGDRREGTYVDMMTVTYIMDRNLLWFKGQFALPRIQTAFRRAPSLLRGQPPLHRPIESLHKLCAAQRPPRVVHRRIAASLDSISPAARYCRQALALQ